MTPYDPEHRAAMPSRIARTTGYRRDSAAHQAARLKVDPERRAEIAAMGAAVTNARWQQPATAPLKRAQRAPIATPPARPAADRAAKKAAAAARAAASRPARRAAAKAAKLAAERKR